MANGTLAASQIEMLSQSGTGIITITPPATNTNRAITLPDAAGEVVLNSATQTLTNKTIQGGAITAATAVTASGTSIDFTSIPAWVKRITVMFSGVSLSGTSNYLIQLGDSGGVETTGYTGTSNFYNQQNQTAGISSTSGLPMTTAGNASLLSSGHMVITLLGSNTWVSSHITSISTTSITNGAGTKTLSDTLTQVRITTVNGTDTFDAGSINILYEG